MTAQEISTTAIDRTLKEALKTFRLEVLDESHEHKGHAGASPEGRITHVRVKIDSPFFYEHSKKIPRVRQHRLVYEVLQPYFDAGLHALAIELLSAQTHP